jgi:hypothetical protein
MDKPTTAMIEVIDNVLEDAHLHMDDPGKSREYRRGFVDAMGFVKRSLKAFNAVDELTNGLEG